MTLVRPEVFALRTIFSQIARESSSLAERAAGRQVLRVVITSPKRMRSKAGIAQINTGLFVKRPARRLAGA